MYIKEHRQCTSGEHVPVINSTPLLYSKNWVCRGIPIFLNFAPKHSLWVLAQGGTLKFSVYIGEADFFGVKFLNFRIFLGFQKN